MNNEIFNFIEVFSKDERYKDIKNYFTKENHFFNKYKCQLFLYVRDSTKSQDFGRQIIEIYLWLKKKNISVCIDNIYCDKYTGKKLDRENYQIMRNIAKENDYILLSNLNRLGRGNVNEGYENIKKEWYYYKYKGVKILICEDELNEYISAPLPFENKEYTLNRLYMQDLIFINTLYKDCLKILEVSNSTKSGLEKARMQGKRIGKPRTEFSSKNNFINVLEYMINNNAGQIKSANVYNYPIETFKNDIKKCYEKYNTKDYSTLLQLIRKDETTW